VEYLNFFSTSGLPDFSWYYLVLFSTVKVVC
jgi:hypothetical protein